jgi:hypothetical protein
VDQLRLVIVAATRTWTAVLGRAAITVCAEPRRRLARLTRTASPRTLLVVASVPLAHAAVPRAFAQPYLSRRVPPAAAVTRDRSVSTASVLLETAAAVQVKIAMMVRSASLDLASQAAELTRVSMAARTTTFAKTASVFPKSVPRPRTAIALRSVRLASASQAPSPLALPLRSAARDRCVSLASVYPASFRSVSRKLLAIRGKCVPLASALAALSTPSVETARVARTALVSTSLLPSARAIRTAATVRSALLANARVALAALSATADPFVLEDLAENVLPARNARATLRTKSAAAAAVELVYPTLTATLHKFADQDLVVLAQPTTSAALAKFARMAYATQDAQVSAP